MSSPNMKMSMMSIGEDDVVNGMPRRAMDDPTEDVTDVEGSPVKEAKAFPRLKAIQSLGIDSDKDDDDSQQAKGLPLWLDLLTDWVCTIMVGILVVSYWRGSWVILDYALCDQPGSASLMGGDSFCFAVTLPKVHWDSAWLTYVIGYIMLVVGLGLMGSGLWQPKENARVTPMKGVQRFMIVYILGGSTVCIWRGIWYMLDYYLIPNNPVQSFWTSCVAGAALCYCLLSAASMLAPPAIFLIDGPSLSPPPLAVTILPSYRSISLSVADAARRAKQEAQWIVFLDMFVSYAVLPWGVVGFWRGLWLLMDNYLWGFTGSFKELHLSILYSFILGMGCLVLASEDVTQHIPLRNIKHPTRSKIVNQVVGRLCTLVLAIGAVNFWRAIWYVWDEWLGETQLFSAILAHVIGVVGLTALGCLSCITAPPSTIGVDAIAHPECADEPLFSSVPVPKEMLRPFNIARHPTVQPLVEPSVEMGIPNASFAMRLTRQASSQVFPTTRSASVSREMLSKRHSMTRENSQFFRSR